MRKKYIQKSNNDSDFWNDNWNKNSLNNAIKYCNIDVLRQIFIKYFPKKGRILEGGCGLGQYVIYYRSLGYEIEGIDFAEDAVKTTKRLYPSVPINVGDVRQLKYSDSYFKAYYSGGVIEHFEEGADRVLKEIYRVLDKDGILIITVPYLNLIRRIQDFFYFKIMKNKCRKTSDIDNKSIIYKVVNKCINDKDSFNDFKFHEYQYSLEEIHSILKKNKFTPIFYRGIGILWGLKDFNLFRKWFNGLSHKDNAVVDSLGMQNGNKYHANLLRSILITENEHLIIGLSRFLLYIPKLLFANLLLLVCRKQSV